MDIVWLIFCTIVIWICFYIMFKKEAKKENGEVDGFDIALITAYSIIFCFLLNVGAILIPAFVILVWKTPTILLIFGFLFCIYWLFEKVDALLSRINSYMEDRTIEKEERMSNITETLHQNKRSIFL